MTIANNGFPKIIFITLLLFNNAVLAGDNCEGDSVNSRGILSLANGDKYEGEVKEGKPDGNGKHKLANGDKYIGEFKSDKRDG